MTTFIKKLAKVFGRKKIEGAYLIYSKFINLQNSNEMSEHLYHKMTNYETQLPDTVLIFKLFDGAKLTDGIRN